MTRSSNGGKKSDADSLSSGRGRAQQQQQHYQQLFDKLHSEGLSQGKLPPEFNHECIADIVKAVQKLFGSEANCLQVNASAVLFGDIHGEYHTVVKLVQLIGLPLQQALMFLGDFVDRGPHSLEAMLYLMLLKLVNPQRVFLIRGNHEDRRIFRFFTFEQELQQHFDKAPAASLSQAFHEMFCHMPVCAVLNRRMFCCHGGLSPMFNHPKFASNLDELIAVINKRRKPVEFQKYEFVCDLLWSDSVDDFNVDMPSTSADVYDQPAIEFLKTRIASQLRKEQQQLKERQRQQQQQQQQQQHHHHHQRRRSRSRSRRRRDASQKRSADLGHSKAARCLNLAECQLPAAKCGSVEWITNPRGCSFMFTRAACERFLQKFNLRHLVRAHMYVPDGARFEFNNGCVTLFSAADYAQRSNNLGAILFVSAAAPVDNANTPGKVVRYSKTALLKCDDKARFSRLPDRII